MKFRFLLEYAAISLLDRAFRGLSWETAQQIGMALGGGARRLGKKRWAMTLRNLELAFPEKSPSERETIALEAWRNAGRIGAEFIKSRHLSKEKLMDLVRFEDLELVDRVLKEGKGVIVNIGHMGNWEVGGVSFTAHGYPLGVVGRVMTNPLLDRWVRETRGRFGEAVFPHHRPFFPAAKWLKSGRMVAVLIDHNLYEGGIFVDFFGRPAATSTLSGLLAAKLGSPIVSTRMRREGPRLVIGFDGPLRPDPAANPDQEAERLTVEMIKILENNIRANPGQWLWGHDRWKRQP